MNEILIIKREKISEDMLNHFAAKDYNATLVQGPLYTSHYLKEKKIEAILFYVDQINDEEQMELIDIFNNNAHVPIITVKKDYTKDHHLLSIIQATQKEIDFLETQEKFTELLDSLVFGKASEPSQNQNPDESLDFNRMLEHERKQIDKKDTDKAMPFDGKKMSDESVVSNNEKDLLASL